VNKKKNRFKIGDEVVIVQMDLFDNSLFGRCGKIRAYRQTKPVTIEVELNDNATHVMEESAVDYANINDMYGTTERF
jgi:hypothetical protein